MYDNAELIRRVIGILGTGHTGLVTDIDGTISPIVARPEDAVVLPMARDALAGLRDLLAVVAVVTGRSVQDACNIVQLDGLTYIGNHGLEMLRYGRPETLPEAQPWITRIAVVVDQLSRALNGPLAEGIIIENKGPTASLHYRLSLDPDAVRVWLLELLARCDQTGELRVEEGRRVINLLPPLTVTKGSAVTWLVGEHKLDGIVYIGDDLTDAHAFRALETFRQARAVRTLGIAVVGAETPATVRQLADASVPSVADVAELLRGVLDRLKSSDTMGSRVPRVGST